MPKQPRSSNWFEPDNDPIICPQCQRGHAQLVRRFPDPTRPHIELRTYSCPKCHHQTVLSVKKKRASQPVPGGGRSASPDGEGSANVK